MTTPSLRSAAALALGLFVATLTGCSGGSSQTKGKLTENGSPVKLSPTGRVEIIFMPDVKPGEHFTSYPAAYNPADGTFTTPDMPPGKYKVHVKVFDPDAFTDKLKGNLSGDNAKLMTVTAKDPIEIDIAKK